MSVTGESEQEALRNDSPYLTPGIPTNLFDSYQAEVAAVAGALDLSTEQKLEKLRRLAEGLSSFAAQGSSFAGDTLVVTPTPEPEDEGGLEPDPNEVAEETAEPKPYRIGEIEFDPAEAGITKPDQLFLLDFIARLEKNEFTAKMVLASNFREGDSENTRRGAFKAAAAKLYPALAAVLGEPAVRIVGVKGGAKHKVFEKIHSPGTETAEINAQTKGPEDDDLLVGQPEGDLYDRRNGYQAVPKEDSVDELEEDGDLLGPSRLVNAGFLRAAERHRRETEQFDEDSQLLREALTDDISRLIASRQPRPTGKTVFNAAALIDNVSRVLTMHWGLEKVAEDEPPIPSKNLDTISTELDLTPYSIKSLIREQLKNLVRGHDPKAAKRAQAYLDFIDNQ
ncbi:MAG TPA: hypothetical protein VFP32_02250 [Candidatus Saccharimonadales bacterium]|nr:hypothetical protein [Candidatus Saccharimonadales bacterium]